MNPHEIMLITAHTPDEHRMNLLRNLVIKFKDNNKKILISSHSKIDDDIIDMVDYFVYDSNNQLLIYNEPEGWIKTTCTNLSQTIITKDSLYLGSPVLAHWRTLSNGLILCKSVGFKYVHYLEFDTKINSIVEIDTNTKLLQQGNANVVYTFPEDIENPKKYFNLEGHYNVWNLDYYSFEELSFNEEKVRCILQDNQGCCEWAYYDFFIKNKPHIIKNQHILSDKGIFLDLHHNTWNLLSSKGLIEPLLYVEDNIISAYINNPLDKSYSLVLIINNKEEIYQTVDSGHWLSFSIGDIQNINNLIIYLDGKFLREISFKDNTQRETFKNNNYIMVF
jgi:hypothetical protein